MLSDEQLLDAYHGDDQHRHILMDGAHSAGLRAVESAVRADEREKQIEKDAVIAESQLHPNQKPCGVCKAVAAIRAQLTEGEGR